MEVEAVIKKIKDDSIYLQHPQSNVMNFIISASILCLFLLLVFQDNLNKTLFLISSSVLVITTIILFYQNTKPEYNLVVDNYNADKFSVGENVIVDIEVRKS